MVWWADAFQGKGYRIKDRVIGTEVWVWRDSMRFCHCLLSEKQESENNQPPASNKLDDDIDYQSYPGYQNTIFHLIRPGSAIAGGFHRISFRWRCFLQSRFLAQFRDFIPMSLEDVACWSACSRFEEHYQMTSFNKTT